MIRLRTVKGGLFVKIIIAGAGRIGTELTKVLSEEGHDITLIDENADIIYHASNAYDVICVEGNATIAETLVEAGADTADILIAATQKDEVNMVCGISAKKLGTKEVIVRVRETEYMKQSEFLRDALGISFIINPEYECAKEISRILRFPSAARVEVFSKSSTELVEHHVREDGKLDGVKLKDLERLFKAKVLVGIVKRGEEIFIPNGDFALKGGDTLEITGLSNEVRKFFISAGEYRRPIKDVIIMGGGRISVYLASLLIDSGIDVTVIEMDRAQCERFCEIVPKAHVICADGTSNEVLLEENIKNVGGFVALTGDDGDNIVTSMYASKCGVEKIVTKVNRDHYSDIIDKTILESLVTPKNVIAQQLARYVRAMDNSMESGMESLYRIADGKAEALEFRVSAGAKCIGKPLKDLRIRKDMIIAAIIHGSKAQIPNGNSVISEGDHVIVITAAGRLNDIDSIIEEAAG